MDKLAKRLNKYNKNYLFKQKTNIRQHKLYRNGLMRQGLFFKLKDDEDFINFEIIKTSFDNMRKIQKEFYEIKQELEDLWDVISYQEKHFLLYQKLSPFMDSLKHFFIGDKRYFITFFDELINAYYDHDMLMFENEAYRKFIYDFKKLSRLDSKFGILPLQAGFSQVRFIIGDKDNYVVYSDKVNRFYLFGDTKLDFGLSKDLSDQQIAIIAKYILENDKEGFVYFLIEENLGNKRLIKKLKRKAKKF